MKGTETVAFVLIMLALVTLFLLQRRRLLRRDADDQ